MVAVAGFGVAGRARLRALSRLWAASLHLADTRPLKVEHAPFGAAVGAAHPGVGVRAITTFDPGRTGAILEGVDVVVDFAHFSCVDAHRALAAAARARSLPVVLTAPVGFGASVVVLLPRGATFEEHFSIDDSLTPAERTLAFGLGLGLGLVPCGGLCAEVAANRPGLGSALPLAAGLGAAEVEKLLNGRGAPHGPPGFFVCPHRGIAGSLPRWPHLRRTAAGRYLCEDLFGRYPHLRDPEGGDRSGRA